MPDRKSVITHLQIIHTWAEFAREHDLQFFTAKHLENVAQWADDALALLKEQEAEIRQLRFARDIAKETFKGIKSGVGKFADGKTTFDTMALLKELGSAKHD